jgi:hypothetical protein
MSLTLTSGDQAPTLTGTLNAVTAGATAAVHIKRADDTVISRATTTLVSGATSTWTLDLITGDLTVPGTYELEVEVTYSSGKVQTFAKGADGRPVTFVVRTQIS